MSGTRPATTRGVWLLAALILATLFSYPHLAGHLQQDAPYRYLTTKTSLHADTCLYAAFSGAMQRHPGPPSDTSLLEHRGERIFPWWTYSLPVVGNALLGTLLGDLDLGVQLAGWLCILLTVWVLRRPLDELGGGLRGGLFLLCFLFCLSPFCRPELLEHPSYLWAWLGRHGNGATCFNEFHNANNIQLSFLYLALFLFCLGRLWQTPGPRWAICTGLSLAALLYCYFYYALQGAGIFTLLSAASLLRREGPRTRMLLLAGGVALLLSLPVLWAAWDFLSSPLLADMSGRLGVVPAKDHSGVAWRLLVLAAVHTLLCRVRRVEAPLALLLQANLWVVALLLLASSLSGTDLQTGHLMGRAFYPQLALTLGHVLVLLGTWRPPGRRVGVWVPLLACAGMLGMQFGEARAVSQRTSGYHTLEADTTALFSWLRGQDERDLVVGSLDPELIRLLPGHTRRHSFLALGTTTTATDEELLERFAFACRAFGMQRSELARRLRRELPWNITAADMSRGQFGDLEQYAECRWVLTQFGRAYRVGSLRPQGRLSEADEARIASRGLADTADYFPLAEREALLRAFDAADGAPRYRLDLLIQGPFERKGCQLDDSSLAGRLSLEQTFGRYRVYRFRAPGR